jgi:hypothetical protein
MRIRSVISKGLFVMLALLIATSSGFAQDETVENAEKLMIWQLEVVKNGDYQQFIEHGNKAFKKFMDEYSFDSIKMQRGAKIAKGYTLEYLGAIRRIGMQEYLWKVHITNDKYELLGSLSLSHGKVVGFNLD